MRRLKPWFRVLRPLISVVLLVLLLRSAGPGEFLQRAAGARGSLLAAAGAVAVLAVVLNARRWQLLLAVQGVRTSLGRLFSAHLVGLFFNNFLPTSIGGDVMRVGDVARHTGRTAEAAASVVAERVLAALALAVTAAIGLAASPGVTARAVGPVAGLVGLAAAAVLLFTVAKWRRAVTGLVWLPARWGLRRAVGGFVDSLAVCLGDWKKSAVVMAYSVASQLLVTATAWVVFLALGVNVSPVYCVLFIPVITALQMLPVSVSGFGVREGAYVYFFGAVGVSPAEAVSASLVYWALIAVVSLPGGVIFALRR